MHFNCLNNFRFGLLFVLCLSSTNLLFSQTIEAKSDSLKVSKTDTENLEINEPRKDKSPIMILESKQDLENVVNRLFEVYGNNIEKATTDTILILKEKYEGVLDSSKEMLTEVHKLFIDENSIILTIKLIGKDEKLIKNEFSDKTRKINDKLNGFVRIADGWESKVEYQYLVDVQHASDKKDEKTKGAPNNSAAIKAVFKRKWKDLNRPVRLVFAYNAGSNFTSLLLAPTDFNQSTNNGLEDRKKNELGSFGYSGNFMIGLSRYQHGFFGTYSQSSYGVNFRDSASLNLETGFYDSQLAFDGLKLNMRAVGFHYRFADYVKRFSPYGRIGVSVNWLTKEAPVSFVGLSSSCTIGLNYKPAHWFEAHVGPTGTFFLAAIEGERITSRPFSLGVEVGIAINFGLPL